MKLKRKKLKASGKKKRALVSFLETNKQVNKQTKKHTNIHTYIHLMFVFY